MTRSEHRDEPYPWDDERLSAYLDGELTAPEYAQLESRLVVDPDLRRLVEELRAVRRHLERLPEYRLEADFAASVLRRAAAESNSGEANTAESSAAISENSPTTPTPMEKSSVGLNAALTPLAPNEANVVEPLRTPPVKPLRRIAAIWATVSAVAALLLIVVARRGELGPQDVAQNPIPAKPETKVAHDPNIPKSLTDGQVAPSASLDSTLKPQGISEETLGDANVRTLPSAGAAANELRPFAAPPVSPAVRPRETQAEFGSSEKELQSPLLESPAPGPMARPKQLVQSEFSGDAAKHPRAAPKPEIADSRAQGGFGGAGNDAATARFSNPADGANRSSDAERAASERARTAAKSGDLEANHALAKSSQVGGGGGRVGRSPESADGIALGLGASIDGSLALKSARDELLVVSVERTSSGLRDQGFDKILKQRSVAIGKDRDATSLDEFKNQRSLAAGEKTQVQPNLSVADFGNGTSAEPNRQAGQKDIAARLDVGDLPKHDDSKSPSDSDVLDSIATNQSESGKSASSVKKRNFPAPHASGDSRMAADALSQSSSDQPSTRDFALDDATFADQNVEIVVLETDPENLRKILKDLRSGEEFLSVRMGMPANEAERSPENVVRGLRPSRPTDRESGEEFAGNPAPASGASTPDALRPENGDELLARLKDSPRNAVPGRELEATPNNAEIQPLEDKALGDKAQADKSVDAIGGAPQAASEPERIARTGDLEHRLIEKSNPDTASEPAGGIAYRVRFEASLIKGKSVASKSAEAKLKANQSEIAKNQNPATRQNDAPAATGEQAPANAFSAAPTPLVVADEKSLQSESLPPTSVDGIARAGMLSKKSPPPAAEAAPIVAKASRSAEPSQAGAAFRATPSKSDPTIELHADDVRDSNRNEPLEAFRTGADAQRPMGQTDSTVPESTAPRKVRVVFVIRTIATPMPAEKPAK